MRILMINSFHYLRGGAERCFFDLSDLLRAEGHEVIPFCMKHEQNWPSPYEEYFISHIDYPSLLKEGGMGSKLRAVERTIYSREARRNIERLIADVQPDIAHVHGIAHEMSPSILPALKAHNIPVVQTLHDYKLVCPNTSFITNGRVCEACKGGRYYNMARNRCKRGSLAGSVLASVEMYAHKATQIYEKNVDIFISPSQFLLEKVAEHGVKNQVVNIPNFIDVDSFETSYEPSDYFVYMGRIVDIKGVDTLLEAMRSVPQGHLHVIGGGERREDLIAFTHEAGIENVTFHGHLDKSEWLPLIRGAAFTVAPSKWYENYPMSVLEAMASGTPVIGARMGGIPEIVRHGETGLLFEAGNVVELASAMNQLLDDPAEAARMGKNGRLQIEQINSPQAHYQQTMAVYEQLVKQPRVVA